MGEISQVSVKGTLFDIRDRITEEMALAEYPTREIAGDLIYITDAAEAPLKNLSITLTPVQSGTGDPSPTNIRPISGVDSVTVSRTGKNVFKVTAAGSTNLGITRTITEDGVVTLNGTATGLYTAILGQIDAGTYILNGCPSGGSESTYRLDCRTVSGGSTLAVDYGNGSSVFTATERCNVIIRIPSGATVTDKTFYPMVRPSTTTDATFEPYVGQTYSVSLPQTVYSGVVDVTGGTVTIDKVMYVSNGSENWTAYRAESGSTYSSYSCLPFTSSVKPAWSIDNASNGLCSIAPISGNSVYNHDAVACGIDSNGRLIICVPSTLASTPADFKTYLASNNVQVLATLVTPQVIQLTPQEITTLLNENYIWANSGVISLTYRQKFDVRLTEAVAKVLPTETASGDIVSISDGAEDIPVKALTVAVEPVQAGSGDPSPDNIRTITGWDAVNVVRTGKNLFDPNSTDKEWVRTSDWAIITQNSAKSVRVKAVEGEIFTLSNANTASATNVLLLAFLSSDGTVISRNFVASGTTFITRTAPANSASLLAAFFTWSDVSNAQLELGSSATTYEPYQGTTYPISLPSTVYGGTLDVSTGVMTVDRTMVDLGTCEWNKATGSSSSLVRFYTISIKSTTAKASNNNTAVDLITSMFVTGTANEGYTGSKQNCVTIDVNGTLSIYPTTTYEDAEAFKSAMSGQTLVYPLATPQTVQLTPTEVRTLLGDNVIFSDAGQVSVAYRADVGLYIDKRIAEVQALVLEG